MIEDDDIDRAAAELFARYGDRTVARARERAEMLSGSEDPKALNAALRVLSAVEKLVGGERVEEDGRER